MDRMMFPGELLDFHYNNSKYRSPTHDNYRESKDDNNCCYYPIRFDFDTELLLSECQNADDLFIEHRAGDKKGGYGHHGWKSLTLHGIDKHKTEHYVRYGFSSLEDANYHWTDACERLPNLTKFLQSLPYKLFDRVRIMRLDGGGYIMPHSDNNHERAFSPLNIAINNPNGCHFVFREGGIVPFTAGTGMILDVGREHIVINRSNDVRYHVIVHGHYAPEFYNL
jgi:hypothetical protein